ncbi:MAG TPA: dihydrofolate reductase family protein [Polyangiaceae bacterium]|nr:dihydrofolate reductase family protein [Polyangiaceae bacterium]
MKHRLTWSDEQTASASPGAAARPHVIISYAQSLDGTISAPSKAPIRLSCDESMTFVHHLRAHSDAILIGIETVLSDDPQLTVRLVEGQSPQPIILDGRLRFPLEARMLGGPLRPWIFTSMDPPADKHAELVARGARVFPSPLTAEGLIDIDFVLQTLHDNGVRRLMVEGGRRVITRFLRQNCVDTIYVTISPQLLGGLNVVESDVIDCVHLEETEFRIAGVDVILSAVPRTRNLTAQVNGGH